MRMVQSAKMDKFKEISTHQVQQIQALCKPHWHSVGSIQNGKWYPRYRLSKAQPFLLNRLHLLLTGRPQWYSFHSQLHGENWTVKGIERVWHTYLPVSLKHLTLASSKWKSKRALVESHSSILFSFPVQSTLSKTMGPSPSPCSAKVKAKATGERESE